MSQPYKQVSPEQVQIWLNDPVTIGFLDCVTYLKEKAEESMSSGRLIDPKNNDLTCHNIAYTNGMKDTLIEVSDPGRS